jgi:hypothetical protein
MRIRSHWSDVPSPECCPECGRLALPGEAEHRSDCRFFVTEDEQNEEPVTIEDWVRASTGWKDQDGFYLRPPVAA